MAASHIQTNGNAQTSAAASNTQAFGSNVTSGNLIVVGVVGTKTGAPTFTVTDSQGNAYSSVLRKTQASNFAVEVFSAKAGSTAACTVTVTPNASATLSISCSEYQASAGNICSKDGSASAGASASGSLTVTGATFLGGTIDIIYSIVGSNGNAGTVTGAGGSWNERFNAGNTASANDIEVQDFLNTGSTQNPSWTFSGTANLAGIAVNIKDTKFVQLGNFDIYVANETTGTVGILAGNGDGTFQAMQEFTAKTAPNMVAFADLNGDGKQDMVVTNSNSAAVSVLLGNGNGTFGTQTTFASKQTEQLALADISGDGKIDILTTDFADARMSVLLGNGNGTFGAETTFTVGSTPKGIALADLNGDGSLDAVVGNNGSSFVSVLLGNGNGTFAAQTTFTSGTSSYGVVIADVDGDGKLDLVVSNPSDNCVSVLLGNGNGTFGAATTFAVKTRPYDVVLGDLNGDGKLDMVVVNYSSPCISVLLGNGNGTFQTQVTYATGTGVTHGATGLALADVNGDGILDIVVANWAAGNTVGILVGNGDGTFKAAQTFGTGVKPAHITITKTTQASNIVHVQTNGTATTAAAASQTVVFNANVTSGDWIVVGITGSVAVGGAPTFTVTDSRSSSYSSVVRKTNTTLAVEVYSAKVLTTGACTVTVTPSASATLSISCSEYNVPAGKVLSADGTANNSGAADTSLSVTGASLATGVNDLGYAIVGTLGNATTITGTGLPWSQRFINSNVVGANDMQVEDQLNITGAVTPTWTVGIAALWAGVVANFVSAVPAAVSPVGLNFPGFGDT